MGYYVYALLDNSNVNKKVFYIGKGKDDEVFKKTDKEENYKNIERWILAHHLDENQAFMIENVFINFFGVENLENEIKGHAFQEVEGILSTEEVELAYAAKEADITRFNNLEILLVSINNSSFRGNKDPYEATRQSWNISLEKAKKVDYFIGIYKGIIQGIYKSTGCHQLENGRVVFNGVSAEEYKDLINCSSVQFPPFGSGNPVRYYKSK